MPLVLAIGAAVGLVVWAALRSGDPPVSRPRISRPLSAQRPETIAYAGLQQGRRYLTVYGLWRRLALAVRDRFQVHIDRPSEFAHPGLVATLTPPLTLSRLVDDITRAYTSAYRADEPGWIAQRWSWLRYRQIERANQDFAKALDDLAWVLPALETP